MSKRLVIWLAILGFILLAILCICNSRDKIERDIQERGRDLDEVLNRYQDTLKPMHDQFIEPTKNFADMIIPNDRYNTVAIDIVRTVISEKLAKDVS